MTNSLTGHAEPCQDVDMTTYPAPPTPYEPTTHRAWFRSLSTEQRAAYGADRDAAAATERANREAERAARMADRYTDATLRANTTSDMAGVRREAELLLTVPEHVRRAIVRDAHRTANMTGQRWSDSIQSAIASWRGGFRSCAGDGTWSA